MIKQILAFGGLSLSISIASTAMAQDSVLDENYVQPMTAWGEPDIQGIWPLNHLISVPQVRKPEYGDRLYLTDEEYVAAQEATAARDDRFLSGAIPQADAAGRAMRQTSLIVDPVDGQYPTLTELGTELQANMRGSYRPNQTVFDGISDFSAWDRCITRGMPVSMMPRNYNNGIRIFQAPGYVAISLEMAHEVRIIPTNDAPLLESEIKQWMGESRGHWEGNTLVVETTNFNGKVGKTSAGVPGSPGPLQPSTEEMRTVERFTRVADDTMEFEMVIEDPSVLARGSFKIQYPMYLDNDYKVYEYACHEGNTAIRYYIETSRFERAQAANN